MTIIKHELKRGAAALAIWAGAIGFLMLVCVLIYPDMKGDVDSIGDLFSSMGGFTAAFGMDQVNFGSLMGFYGIECGNILGLGGALYAALLGAAALAGEEKGHTAEFLLSHPVSRGSVTAQKLAAAWIQILLMNAVVILISLLSIHIIGETLAGAKFWLLHLAYLLMQWELCCVCFGLSAFGGGSGLGIGLAMGMYFMNLIANIAERADFLKYISPFGYADGADIIHSGVLNGSYLAVGALLGVLGIAAAFIKYCHKDIAA